MRILTIENDLAGIRPDPVLLVAFDGWTDAGAGGTGAAELLREQFAARPVGRFDADALFDYRDRRPALEIDHGRLGSVRWPELILQHLAPSSGPDLLLLTGPEPDLGWRALAADLAELADAVGGRRYVGLGSVPGPLPHTRPVQMVCTSNDAALLERLGGPHEQMIVPASAQVAIEAELGAHGLTTLGMWVRIPHYVAGPYPEASRALLERLSAHLGTPVDLSDLDRSISQTPPEQRTAEQIETIRRVGEQMLEAARQAAGGDGTIPVSIRYTDTGAVFLGLVIDPVTGASIEIPVEDVALLIGGGLVIMVGGISADGDPAGIEFDGVLQLGQGGWIAVLGFGLEPDASGEVIVMSTPRLLGRFRTDVTGGAAVQARIPSDLEVGEHTAVVSAGGDSASIGFRVVDGASAMAGSLPSTGSDSEGALPWVVLLLSLGGLAVLVDRRRLV
jgi:LPXTG-motif cell wall-anchored protein